MSWKMPIIDIHTHGIGGCDTKCAGPEDILRIAEIHGSHGVDAIIPTIYSASVEQMRLDITAVKKAMEMQAAGGSGSRPAFRWFSRGFKVQGSGFKKKTMVIGQPETVNRKLNPGTKKNIELRTLKLERRPSGDASPAAILGVHLEGPFLNPARGGALDVNSFLPTKISHYKELIEGFGEVVKIITVAPELDGASLLIKSIADTGIIVSMGHSNATHSEAEAGFNAGAKGITHIFNAMRDIHHREPGISGFGLTNPHIYVEIIADPFHLHPKTIELIFSAKKPGKIIIVSDSVKNAQADITAQGITDSTGRLLGGSTTITESAQYLIGLGFQKDRIERCISNNPEMYLIEGPSLTGSP